MADNEKVTVDEVDQALLAAIKRVAENTEAGPGAGRRLRDLAEALAWVQSPHQPHGGGSSEAAN
jgi:hypothetical protein